MQEKDDIEKKQKEAQRKREYRAKVKAIADDSYVPTAIEEGRPNSNCNIRTPRAW